MLSQDQEPACLHSCCPCAAELNTFYCLQILKVLRAPAVITRQSAESNSSQASEAGNKRKREDAGLDDASPDLSDATDQVGVTCQPVAALLGRLCQAFLDQSLLGRQQQPELPGESSKRVSWRKW